MKIIQQYKNGDTYGILFDNGTRILDNHSDEPFNLEWPVSIDLNISNYCEKGCPFCYQNCTREGKSADLNKIKDLLHPFMEVAININMGYNIIDTQFTSFLQYCKDNHIVVNATINQEDLLQLSPHNYDIGKMTIDRLTEISTLQDMGLINGLGISFTNINTINEVKKKIKNVVIHVIAGIINTKDLDILTKEGYNILILGYKQKGRAEHNELPDMSSLKEWLKNNLGNNKNVLCFDNLAIKQLGVKELISQEQWDNFYQGDEGTISMYVNGVDMTFACNSFTKETYNIGDYSIQEMFNIIRKEKQND